MNQINKRYDVTIAGAGPSGAVLAYELARQGIKVLLLEKSKLPREKVCAGGITTRARAILPFDFSPIVENVIYGVRLSFNSAPKKTRTYPQPLAYMVSRDKFDYFLSCRAREAGATLQDGVELQGLEIQPDRVDLATNRGSFSTPVLVGADGANSAVVRCLGLKSGFDYGIGINGCLSASKEIHSDWDGLMGLDYGIPGGYSWVFPKENCLSVGAGGLLREAKKLKAHSLRLISSYRLGAQNEYRSQGHLMPLKKAATILAHQRVLLVGDAAGMIDPLTGEGIYNGVKSSFLAAPVIIKFLEGKSGDMTAYDQAICRELMPELKIARTIQRINTITPRLFFHFLENDERFWRAFCRLLRGERTYQSLKSRLNPPLRLLFSAFS